MTDMMKQLQKIGIIPVVVLENGTKLDRIDESEFARFLAENPNINYKRALEISSKTMNGEKAFAFVLGLSFIGWIMLCMLTWGIGAMFLPPYMNATYTEYYMYLKNKAISSGYADPSEFTKDGTAAPVTACSNFVCFLSKSLSTIPYLSHKRNWSRPSSALVISCRIPARSASSGSAP